MFSTGLTLLLLNFNSPVTRYFENSHSVGRALQWRATRTRWFCRFYISWPFKERVQSLISSWWESPWIAVPKLGSFLLGHMHSMFTPSTEWCGNLNLNVVKWKPHLSNPLDEKTTAVTQQKDMHTFHFFYEVCWKDKIKIRKILIVFVYYFLKKRENLVFFCSLTIFLKSTKRD